MGRISSSEHKFVSFVRADSVICGTSHIEGGDAHGGCLRRDNLDLQDPWRGHTRMTSTLLS